MSRTALTLTTAVLAALHAPRLAAQATPEPGTVVRAHIQPPSTSPYRPAPPVELVEGRFVASDSTQLLLVREDGDTLTVPLETLRQLDLRGEGSPQILKGALVGAIMGGVVGAVIGSQRTVVHRCEASYCLTTGGGVVGPGEVSGTSTETVAVSQRGALIGGLVGALLGATFKSYRWTPVRTDQLHLGVLPAGRGMKVGLSAAF